MVKGSLAAGLLTGSAGVAAGASGAAFAGRLKGIRRYDYRLVIEQATTP